MNSTCKTNMRNTGNKQRTNTRNLNITQMNWSNVSGAEDRRCFISTNETVSPHRRKNTSNPGQKEGIHTGARCKYNGILLSIVCTKIVSLVELLVPAQ